MSSKKVTKYVVLFFCFIALSYGQEDFNFVSPGLQGAYKIPLKSALLNNYIMPDSLREKADSSYKSEGINYPVFCSLIAATGVTIYLINDYYQHSWWKDNRTSFKVVNDWNYALWFDKMGHFYATDYLSFAFNTALWASNFSPEQSVWYGSIAALTFQLYVEVQDGFGPQWGFSPGDATADLLGATYPVLQFYYPRLNDFQPRFSYYPSEEYLSGEKEDGNIVDDYGGQKMWLSVRIKNYLPKTIAKYWPSFLMLAVGYSVSNHQSSGYVDNQIYLAFDLDTEALPLHGKGWDFVKKTFSFIHFPLPGLRISPRLSFKLFTY